MPRFYGRLVHFRLNQAKYNKTLDQAATRLVRQAARAWLRAMILQVPVWSGMARGSIKFASGPGGVLSRYLNVEVPINPIKATRKKNQLTGAPYGRYNFITSRHTYRFKFRSDVPHFILNEFFARTDAGAGGQQIIAPWNSLEAGAAAFRATIRAGIPKLPNPGKAIERTIIPFGK